MISDNDHRKKRCPMLGHEVEFKYCREPGNDIPCAKIGDCWFEIFNVVEFLKSNYSEDNLEAISRPIKPKTLSLFEIMEQVKQRKKEGGPDE